MTFVSVSLRDVVSDDIPIFFEHQQEEASIRMTGFPPRPWEAFTTHWSRILADEVNVNRTIVVDGQVAGSIASYRQDGERDVGYWLGQSFWGRGIATEALRQFLAVEQRRPLYAFVAIQNVASRRVLEKCGFVVTETHSDEIRLRLDAASDRRIMTEG